MGYKLRLETPAANRLRGLDNEFKQEVGEKLRDLAEDPWAVAMPREDGGYVVEFAIGFRMGEIVGSSGRCFWLTAVFWISTDEQCLVIDDIRMRKISR